MFPNVLKVAFDALAQSNDKKATVIGSAAAGLQATTIDFGKVFQGDQKEISQLLVAILLAAWAWYTNKPDKKKEEKESK